MKINREVILKNINALLCVVCIVALVLPFCNISAEVSAMGASSESSQAVNGIKMLTGTGMWGYLFIIALVAVIAFTYLKQLTPFKKIGTLLCSGIMILSLFMSPGKLSASGGEEGLIDAEVSVTYGIGFWLILISSICLAVIAVISFAGLKGNPVFDAIQMVDETQGQENVGLNIPNINFGAAAEKVSSVTKGVTEAVSKQASTIADKAKETMAARQAAVSMNDSVERVQPVSTVRDINDNTSNESQKNTIVSIGTEAVSPIKHQTNNDIIIERENNDYIMDRISKLFEMKEKGILTEEEFTAKKAEYLNKL